MEQEINIYEITTLHGKDEQKHIVNALTAQDAIVQLRVKINCDLYKIVDIKPWVKVYTVEEIIRMNELSERVRLRRSQQKQSENKLNKILRAITRWQANALYN